MKPRSSTKKTENPTHLPRSNYRENAAADGDAAGPGCPPATRGIRCSRPGNERGSLGPPGPVLTRPPRRGSALWANTARTARAGDDEGPRLGPEPGPGAGEGPGPCPGSASPPRPGPSRPPPQPPRRLAGPPFAVRRDPAGLSPASVGELVALGICL